MSTITPITGSEIKIIQFFLEHPLESFAVREIARNAKMDYKQVHTAIQKLAKKNIIHKKRQANLDLCSLNLKGDKTSLCYSEMLKRDFWMKKHPEFALFFHDVLRKIKETNYILLVFGSFAKKKETKNSDLDLMVIAPSRETGDEIGRVIDSQAVFLKRKVHALMLDEREFLANLSGKELNVVREAFKSHIILTGVDAFYNGVRQAI